MLFIVIWKSNWLRKCLFFSEVHILIWNPDNKNDLEVGYNYGLQVVNLCISVTKIKNETGVAIKIPQDSENSNTIRIEGEAPGVKQAKKELLDLASRMVSRRVAWIDWHR